MKINNKNHIHQYGAWAVVTGASSGFGEEFAYQLAELNINLVLIARREDRLIAVAHKIKRETDVEIIITCLDLSSNSFMQEVINVTENLDVGLLINSAGFAITGCFLDHSIEEELNLLNVNCTAPLILTHYFASKMIKKNKGGIIFISSVVAFSAVKEWAGYAASKSHNLILSESLSYELSPHNIDVLTLCPGATRTEFFDKAGLNNNIGADVSKVVNEALNSLGVKKILIPGFLNKYNLFWSKIFPRKLNTWFSSFILNKLKAKKN